MDNGNNSEHDSTDISNDNNRYFTRFEAYLLTEKRVAQNTFQAYKRDIEQLRLFLDSKKINLEKITLLDLKDFLRHLHSMKLAASSTVRKISSLKIFFSYLADRYEMPNMAKKLQLPKMEKKLPHYLSEQEIQKLFEVVGRDSSYQGKRNQAMLYLLYATGMRITELTSLRISDIHIDSGMIAVRGKGGKQRLIPIAKSIVEIIQNYMSGEYRSEVFAKTDTAGRDKNSKLESNTNNNADKSSVVDAKKILKKSNKKTRNTQDDFLFPVRYGGKVRAISRQAFWVLLNDLWKKTGSTISISPHKLRHSFATHMLKNGADLRSLQLLLGHENLSTVQIYTHVETSYLRKVYDKKHPRS